MKNPQGLAGTCACFHMQEPGLLQVRKKLAAQGQPGRWQPWWRREAEGMRSLMPAISPTPLAVALVMPAADCGVHTGGQGQCEGFEVLMQQRTGHAQGRFGPAACTPRAVPQRLCPPPTTSPTPKLFPQHTCTVVAVAAAVSLAASVTGAAASLARAARSAPAWRARSAASAAAWRALSAVDAAVCLALSAALTAVSRTAAAPAAALCWAAAAVLAAASLACPAVWPTASAAPAALSLAAAAVSAAVDLAASVASPAGHGGGHGERITKLMTSCEAAEQHGALAPSRHACVYQRTGGH